MIKNFYILLLLILFSFQETKSSKLSFKNLRNLQTDKPTVAFSSVENLATEGNSIKFDINLGQTPSLEEGSYKITISINDGNKEASCTYDLSSPQKLACTCDCGKPYYGIIELPLSSTVSEHDDISLQIRNKKTFKQTITLTYKNAIMQLVDSSGKYNVQIYLDGTVELPNNAVLQLSLESGAGYPLADCIYSLESNMLDCQVSGSKANKIKFITAQKDGSIKWTNTKFEDDSVIMKLEAQTNIYGYDLDFVDNKWNFKIHMTNSDITFTGYYYYINIILQNIDKNESTKALCYRKEAYKHECSIPEGTQAKNDFVYISPNQEEATLSFDNSILAENKLMIRLITLKFLNIYELTFSHKWIFKIDVEAEGEAAQIVREGLNVTVALFKNNNNYQTGSCLYSKISGKEILSCEEDHSNSDTDLFSLVPQKSVGSVTWSNINTNTEKIKIPLELQLTHVLSYYLAYEETETKWVFNLDAKPSIKIPGKSFILIDILYNTDRNTVAKCEAKSSNDISAGAQTTFICECDLDENQSFQISQIKNMGSVSWIDLTEPITIKKRNEFKFIEAYNLELTYTSSVKKWSFEIKFEDINNLEPTSSIQYSLNIFYTLSPTDNKRSGSATCSLKTGSSNIFSCESNTFTADTIKDIIIYIGKATRKTANYIQWSQELNDYYQITLKTELTFVKGTVSYNEKWSLNINVKDPKDGSLPIGSKLKIDINEDSNSKAIECSVESNLLLKCDTGITSNELNSLPIFSISKTKTDLSSVTWKNTEADESFYILSLETTLSYKSATDMTFSNNKWQFYLDINEVLKDNTRMIIDILYDGQPSTATCIKNTQILCTVDKDGQSKTILVKMNPTKTDKSTITWNNLSENNKDIIAQKEIFVESITSSFIEEKNKWEFKMKLQECDLPINSVVKVGLQKGGSDNTATCTLQSQNMLICIPDEATQESSDVFTIPSESSLGSVTFQSGSTLTIRNAKTLGFSKANDLTINSGDWKFIIELTSSNLNDNDQIDIDIKFNGNNDNAQCVYILSTKTLLCTKAKTTSGDRIILIYNINNQDLTWSNLDEYELYVSYSIKFINYYGDFYQNKWTFNLKYSNNDIEANNNYALLDISVNGDAKTALCKIIPNYLSCISQHSEQNKDDVIKITGGTPTLGTVTLTDVPATIEKIKPLNIKLESPTISDFGYSNNVISFKINGNLKDNEETEIGVNTITGVEIVVGNNDPIDAICLTNSINNSPVILSCEASGTMNKAEDNVDIKVDSNGKSKYVTFDSINENISVYKKGQNSEENTNTSGKSNKNNGFMININYFLFGLILLI